MDCKQKTVLLTVAALGFMGLFVKLQSDHVMNISKRDIGVVNMRKVNEDSRYVKQAQAKMQEDMRSVVSDGKGITNETAAELERIQRESMGPVVDKTRAVMKDVAARENLIAIVHEGDLLAGGRDVTNKVIAELDKDMPVEKKETPQEPEAKGEAKDEAKPESAETK